MYPISLIPLTNSNKRGALAAPVDIRSQSWMDQNVLTTGGNIAEVIGKPTESWASHMSDVQKEAARRAGVRDPALAGEIVV
jgi:hypothetical protein